MSQQYSHRTATDGVLSSLSNPNAPPIDAQDGNGNTMLHLAVMNGHIQTVKLLLTFGASKEIKNKQGLKPEDYLMNFPEMEDILENSDTYFLGK